MCTNIFLRTCLSYFWHTPRSGMLDYVRILFLKSYGIAVLFAWLHPVTLLSVVHRGSRVSAPSPVLAFYSVWIVDSLIGLQYYIIVISICRITIIHVLIGNLRIFGEKINRIPSNLISFFVEF